MLKFGMVANPRPRTTSSKRDEDYMREICEFTARTLETEYPVPFGALIVNSRSGETVLRATNKVSRENDPSSHAELAAVRLACKKLKNISLPAYTMYSTCEPCPMCMANALWAGIDRIVYGATIADANRPASRSRFRRGSSGPFGYAMHGRWPGNARTLQQTFHASEYAEKPFARGDRRCLERARISHELVLDEQRNTRDRSRSFLGDESRVLDATPSRRAAFARFLLVLACSSQGA